MSEKYPEIFTQVIANIVLAVFLIGFILTIFKLYQKKKLVQEKEMESLKSAFEKELLQTKLEIQENVLTNVAMEIHDNIGQVMLLVNVNASILQSMDIPNEAVTLIRETKGLLGKAIEDISQLSRSFHSDRIAEIGAFKAMEHELSLLDQNGLYRVVIDNPEPDLANSLSKEAHLVLFRMYQEIIKNIINHSEAIQIMLSIKVETGGIRIDIEDDGKGFEVKNIPVSDQSGVGMRSLRSRIQLINGTILIKSVLGEGTCVSIFIPTNSDIPKTQ